MSVSVTVTMSQGENGEEPPPAASYTSPSPGQEMEESYQRLGSSTTIKVNTNIEIQRSTLARPD